MGQELSKSSPEDVQATVGNQLRQNSDGTIIGISPDKRIWKFDVVRLREHEDFAGLSEEEIIARLDSSSSETLARYGTEYPNPPIIGIL